MYGRNHVTSRHRHPGPPHAFHRHGPHRGGRGARARRGDVRAAVLALLAEQPMHGYEMITEIEERSGGYWRPSAGSIYPTLQLLEDEGLIAGEESDGKRRFTLTDEGHKLAEEKAEEAGGAGSKPWEQVRGGAPPELVNLGRSVHQLRAAVGQALRPAARSSGHGSASCSTRRAAGSTRSSRRSRRGSQAAAARTRPFLLPRGQNGAANARAAGHA